jgi:hypothetical protein
MGVRKFLRFIGITLGTVVALVLILAVIAIVPGEPHADYARLSEKMNDSIEKANTDTARVGGSFAVGFSKVSLTPPEPAATAGYGKRLGKQYKSIHDSVYVRCLVIDNGVRRVAIVSADLLIIPPSVTALLEQELPGIDFSLDNTYLGATHSHNSIGNWARGIPGVLYGSYKRSIVRFITDQIKISIYEAAKNLQPAVIKMDSVSMPEGVYNRVTDGGPVDPMLRFLKIERTDSSKLLLLSYTAHATCLFSRDLQLSGDYPGKLTQLLESKGYALAMFMAGAVGSHGPAAPEPSWHCVDWMAAQISEKVQSPDIRWHNVTDSTIEMHRVPLALGDAQPEILPDWSLRPWVFRVGFGEYPTFISALRIGNIVFLSTPCDFSGEFNFSIDALAASENVFPIVTSFNGGYIGYLTPEKYHDIDHYETQIMNWYGSGSGEYVKEALEKLMLSVTD